MIFDPFFRYSLIGKLIVMEVTMVYPPTVLIPVLIFGTSFEPSIHKGSHLREDALSTYSFVIVRPSSNYRIMFSYQGVRRNSTVYVHGFFDLILEGLSSLLRRLDKSRRVVRLTHTELNRSEYVEFRSGDLNDFNIFKKILWEQGGYVFSRGKAFHHELILESTALAYPKCNELNVFGWQHEGFYVFTNGISFGRMSFYL